MRRALFVFSLAVVLATILPAVTAQAGSRSPKSEENSTPAIEQQQVKSYSLPPEKYEKAIAYSRAQYRLHFAGAAYSLLLLLIILSLRIAPAFRDWAERLSRRRFIQALIFVPLLLLTFDILKLPLDAYQHRLSRQYDMSVQGWGSWFWDWSKSELIQFFIASVLAYILYGVIRRSPRRWWLYFGLISLPILVFLLFISPIVIDPLFNKFEPLENSHPVLVSEIERVVTHAGLDIPRDRIFEMKASEKVNAVDAYVTGFGTSKRVVVWDTTIAKMSLAQTLYVVGHELGHYVLGHIAKGIAFAGALVIFVLLLVNISVNRTMTRKQRSWAIRGVDDWASLPLLLLFVYFFLFLAEPVYNSFGRYQEHQADVYGLEVIHGIVPDSSPTAAEAFQVLGEVDLADPAPAPFIKFWLYNHPPLAERLAFAREYDPWSKGQPTMFVK
jgi:Zn-dependent protease with chaperone function